ncbi:MAG: DinB family protein [Planctomycetia bacterium]|nr:DinB family protein [Planctomycetia bacterium]
MARTLGNIIGDTLQRSVGYAERLLVGVPAARFARLAAVGGTVIDSNHPAFVYGHLSLYAPKMLQQIGHPAPGLPEHFELLFSKDATCRDDEDGDLYPPMEQITDFFFEGHRMLTGALRSAPDGVFEQANPAGGRMTELFPTLGSVQTFYCGGHMMLHLGQVSAWRRMEGLGAA